MTSTHLIRISEVFQPFVVEILKLLDAKNVRKLAQEYFLFQTDFPEAIENSEAARFIRFHIPVEHSWPCNPEKMEGFVEKAAQSIYYKLEHRNPQTILVGRLDPASPKQYYRALASNFRGRALQVFELPESAPKEVEDQNPQADTLFCLLGKEGLYAGVCSPIQAGGLYPGGTKFVAIREDDTVSRAGAKIAEALHFLQMYRPALEGDAHVLELGASPGGMTSELLKRGYQLTAVDRAPLDARLEKRQKLTFSKMDVGEFVPPQGARYDGLISDMNGPPEAAMRNVLRFYDFLQPGAPLIFTLKTPEAGTIKEISKLENEIYALADAKGLTLIARTHLTYNRREFTLFFEKLLST